MLGWRIGSGILRNDGVLVKNGLNRARDGRATEEKRLPIASLGPRGFGMSMLADNSAVMTKARELCAAIADDADFQALQKRVESFLEDDSARLMYQGVHERGSELHQKQHAGVELGESEIKEFESARDALMQNTIASSFMDAQGELEALQKTIGQYVGMTLELGRVPTADDIAEASGGGCCGGGGGGGGGCGC